MHSHIKLIDYQLDYLSNLFCNCYKLLHFPLLLLGRAGMPVPQYFKVPQEGVLFKLACF